MPGTAAGLGVSGFCCSVGPEASGRGGSPLSLNLGAGGEKAACILSPSSPGSCCQPGNRSDTLPAALLPPAGVPPLVGAVHSCCCWAGCLSAGVASQCTPSLRRMTHVCQPSSALAASRVLAPGSSTTVSAGNQARVCVGGQACNRSCAVLKAAGAAAISRTLEAQFDMCRTWCEEPVAESGLEQKARVVFNQSAGSPPRGGFHTAALLPGCQISTASVLAEALQQHCRRGSPC